MNRSNRLKMVVITFIALLIASPVLAEDASCEYCGMMKSKFGHSWIILEHEDGSKAGLCSIHCAAIHMALHIDKPVMRVSVGDYNTRKQIDAERAYWVIGGDEMGVMTARAKWAFATKEAADRFIETHGGRPATYEESIKAAFEDMYEDRNSHCTSNLHNQYPSPLQFY